MTWNVAANLTRIQDPNNPNNLLPTDGTQVVDGDKMHVIDPTRHIDQTSTVNVAENTMWILPPPSLTIYNRHNKLNSLSFYDI